MAPTICKLTSEERSSDLAFVLKNGWAMDESGRDAIQKKFTFKGMSDLKAHLDFFLSPFKKFVKI